MIAGPRPSPPHLVLKPVTPRARWSLYFAYLPDGRWTAAHDFTLARLRALDAGLVVICAAPSPADVPRQVLENADAICWKGLSGFDFSAYAIGLREVAAHSPGADLLVLNDSVYGPFGDLDLLLARARWALAGFTATAMGENHIQSYGFHIRDVTPDRVRHLRSVLPRRLAFDRPRDVIALQETRMARVAAARMSVGALWFADETVGDPTLEAAIPLLESGYPFLKRGLFTKAAGRSDQAALLDFLKRHGHPLH